MIRFACGSCGKPLRVPSRLAGKRGRCEWCGSVNPVPHADAAPAPQPAAMAEPAVTVDTAPEGHTPTAAARPAVVPDDGRPNGDAPRPPGFDESPDRDARLRELDPPDRDGPSNGELAPDADADARPTQPDVPGDRPAPAEVLAGEAPASGSEFEPIPEVTLGSEGMEAPQTNPPIDVTFDEDDARFDPSTPVDEVPPRNDDASGFIEPAGAPGEAEGPSADIDEPPADDTASDDGRALAGASRTAREATPDDRTALVPFVRQTADGFPRPAVLTVDVKRSVGPSPFRSTADVHVRETLEGVTGTPVPHFAATATPLTVERPAAATDDDDKSHDRTAGDFFDYVSGPRAQTPPTTDDAVAAGVPDDSPTPLQIAVFDPEDGIGPEDGIEPEESFERAEPLPRRVPPSPPPARAPADDPFVRTIHLALPDPSTAVPGAAPAHLRFGHAPRHRLDGAQLQYAVNRALITGGIIGFVLGILMSAWLL